MASGDSRAEVLLGEAWSALTVGDAESPVRPELDLTASAADVGLSSRLPVADTAVACVGLALLAAAGLAEQRGHRAVISLQPGHLGAALTSERHFQVDGRLAGPGFAPLSRFWRTNDGWIRTHANYPWHRQALLDTLGTGEDEERVAAAIQDHPSAVIEEQVVAAGGVAAALRSVGEWAAHPQGHAVASEPLIGHRSIPGAPPRVHIESGLPAVGVRVLDLTRVIAGPVCTRYLGALGADVLRIDTLRRPDLPPGSFADSLFAKRSSAVDLDSPDGRNLVADLLHEADVVVCGYRPGSLDRFGFGPEDLADNHPGLVAVYLSAWGHGGPWANRRGFDSVVQAPTGIALEESSDGDQPGVLPCQLLDHGTGYLAAAAVLDGLRRQSNYGGTQIRTLSLARTAHWLVAAGRSPSASEPTTNEVRADQWIVEVGATPTIRAIAPPGRINRRPLEWPGPPARYLADPPAWSTGPTARRS